MKLQKNAVIFHTHYNFFLNCNDFFQQFYIWTTIFTPTFCRKISAALSVACEGIYCRTRDPLQRVGPWHWEQGNTPETPLDCRKWICTVYSRRKMPNSSCLCLDFQMGKHTSMSLEGAIHAEQGSIVVARGAFKNYSVCRCLRATPIPSIFSTLNIIILCVIIPLSCQLTMEYFKGWLLIWFDSIKS